MPISFKCAACGRGHKAPDHAAGKTMRCLVCKEPMVVPLVEIDPAAILLSNDEPSPVVQPPVEESPMVSEAPPSKSEENYGFAEPEPEVKSEPEKSESFRHPARRSKRSTPDLSTLPPLTTNDPPLWRRHLHWLLVLAMLPLAVSLLFQRNDHDILDRILATLSDASSETQGRFVAAFESDASLDELIELLPNHRVKGAWLPRDTAAHWIMALGSTAMFLVFFMFLASDGSAKPTHVLAVGLFTATIGVGVLLLIQGLASITDGRMLIGKSVLVIFFYILKFIAFSYSAASDPDNSFMLSFLGFTLGVGLCEELIKMVPLFWYSDDARGKQWRGLFIWGLASGAGFGIAEGILYSGRYYNGISGSGIYLVRFVSCVALHAIWSGAIGITLYLRRDTFGGYDSWYDWIVPILGVIWIPMVLHGLYDTCLKRDFNAVALLVAIASFGWLAYLSRKLYGTDDQQATRAMLAEYKRRKKALNPDVAG